MYVYTHIHTHIYSGFSVIPTQIVTWFPQTQWAPCILDLSPVDCVCRQCWAEPQGSVALSSPAEQKLKVVVGRELAGLQGEHLPVCNPDKRPPVLS